MHEIIIALIVIVLILIIYYIYKEGFLTGLYRAPEGFSTSGTIYTSGGTQRFASQFTGTNQGSETITQAAFTDLSQAPSAIVEGFRASSTKLTAGLGENFNTNLRKNSTHMENYSQDSLPSLVLDSVLFDRNIGESGISGTEILLQNSLHGEFYNDNYC